MSSADYAECSKAINQASHSVDVVSLSSITERVEIVSWSDWPSEPSSEEQPTTEDGRRLFRCRRIYDSRPLAWDIDGFIKDIDFEQVLNKGLSQGLWDIHVDREDPNALNEEAEEQRRIERRNKIKEANKRKRGAATDLSPPNPARKRLRKHSSDDGEKTSDEADDDAYVRSLLSCMYSLVISSHCLRHRLGF